MHEPACPRFQFWDAGDFECPCTCGTVPKSEIHPSERGLALLALGAARRELLAVAALDGVSSGNVEAFNEAARWAGAMIRKTRTVEDTYRHRKGTP